MKNNLSIDSPSPAKHWSILGTVSQEHNSHNENVIISPANVNTLRASR